MPRNQRVAFTVLAIAGILALGLGFWQIRHNIRTPFLLKPLKALQANQDSWIDMQTKDTDEDGLSDYDETYLHGTSPYLEDSDSDGKLDGDEVESGSDPNCPEGKECKNVVSAPEKKIGFDTPDSPLTGNIGNGGELFENFENIDLTNLSAEDIREILKASGVEAGLVDQMKDEMLMAIYKEALKESQ